MPRSSPSQPPCNRPEDPRCRERLAQLADPELAALVRAAALGCRRPAALLALAGEGGVRIAAATGVADGWLSPPPELLASVLAAALAAPGPSTGEGPAAPELPFPALLAVPLPPLAGLPPGVLAVAGIGPPRATEEEHTLLALLAGRIAARWETLQRLAALEAEQRELYRQLGQLRRLKEGLRVLRPAIDQSADAVLVSSPNLEPPGPTVLYANPAAARLLGYGEEEMVGMSVWRLYGPATDPDALARLWRALGAGQPARATLATYRKDGQTLWLERQVAPVRNASRQITQLVSILREVPAPDARNPGGEERLAHLFGEPPDLCFRLAADGTVLDHQEASEEMLYVPPEEFLQRRMQEVLPEAAAAAVSSGLAEALAGERVAVRRYELPIGGEPRAFEARFLPLSDREVLLLVRHLGSAPPS